MYVYRETLQTLETMETYPYPRTSLYDSKPRAGNKTTISGGFLLSMYALSHSITQYL